MLNLTQSHKTLPSGCDTANSLLSSQTFSFFSSCSSVSSSCADKKKLNGLSRTNINTHICSFHVIFDLFIKEISLLLSPSSPLPLVSSIIAIFQRNCGTIEINHFARNCRCWASGSWGQGSCDCRAGECSLTAQHFPRSTIVNLLAAESFHKPSIWCGSPECVEG